MFKKKVYPLEVELNITKKVFYLFMNNREKQIKYILSKFMDLVTNEGPQMFIDNGIRDLNDLQNRNIYGSICKEFKKLIYNKICTELVRIEIESKQGAHIYSNLVRSINLIISNSFISYYTYYSWYGDKEFDQLFIHINNLYRSELRKAQVIKIIYTGYLTIPSLRIYNNYFTRLVCNVMHLR